MPTRMPTRASDVTLPGEGATLRGHLALPAGDGPHPALVVVHQIFGLTDAIREVAGNLGAVGFCMGGSFAIAWARALAGRAHATSVRMYTT